MRTRKGDRRDRQQGKRTLDEGVAKRTADFIQLTGLEHAHRTGTRSGYTWRSSAKREGYSKEQSCIYKLLLVCFCFRVPLRRAFLMIAPLLSKQNSSVKVTLIAANLARELAGYDSRQSPTQSTPGAETGRTTRNSRLVMTRLTTMGELEAELDRLLTSFRTIDPDRWHKLKASGLLKGNFARVRRQSET